MVVIVLDKSDYEDACEYERLQLSWYKNVLALGRAYGKSYGQEHCPEATGGVCKGRTGGCSIA